MRKLLLFIFFYIFSACTNQEEIITNYESGKIKWVISVANKQKWGKSYKYYETGEKEAGFTYS